MASQLFEKHLPRRNSAPSLDESYLTDTSNESSCTNLLSSIESTAFAQMHDSRLNTTQEQRTYHDSCQRLLGNIESTMSLCKDLKTTNRDRFPMYYPVQQREKPSITRSQTLDSAIEPSAGDNHRLLSKQDDLNILALGLKLNNHPSKTNLHSSLESRSIASLINDRFEQSMRHLTKLKTRIEDTSSKVLVTGDLNSGKSTFVNALLKRDILPIDQQPCTNLFCEVLDVNLNDGLEQIHAIPDLDLYNRLDPSTFHIIDTRHLYKVITDDYEAYKMLKIYTSDARTTQESLLLNGVVDIALIDSPGLNTDSIKTTEVFARQEEIDVVVFVVSAENHFTLSGKEFLLNAANEKTHIFIVVNRFDSIRDKERCKRLILEQIRQLSPATFADADNLVHFVSARNVDSSKLDPPEFARLEHRLRAFVLENRMKSKLLPAKTYLANLLDDIRVLSESNEKKFAEAYTKATLELEQDLPAYEQSIQACDRILRQVEKAAESTVSSIQRHAQTRLNEAVNQVHHTIDYSGILSVWQYAQDIADSMAQYMSNQVRQEEQYARHETTMCLDKSHDICAEYTGQYDKVADVNLIGNKMNKQVTITVEATDFFEFALDEKFSGVLLSTGTIAMVGGRMLGFNNFFNMAGLRRWVAPAVGVASVGFLAYIVCDMRYVVERKLTEKFKQAARDIGYVDGESQRIARDSRKVMRVEGYEIQKRIQKVIKDKEENRNGMNKVALSSKEAADYFASVFTKSNRLLEKVEMIQTDSSFNK